MKRSISASSAVCSRIRFALTFVKSSLITATSHQLGTHLEYLYCFRKHQLAIHTLLGHETDHTVTGIEFTKLREGTSATVADVVVAEITEGDDRLTGSNGRNERRGQHIVTEQLTRLASLIGRLPQILTVLVLELTDYSDGLVVHDELGALTIRTLECVNQIDDFVGSDLRSACCGHTDFSAASLSKDAQRLADTVTVEEGILFGIGQRLTKLLDDVFLKLEGVVVQKLLSDLHCNMQLVGIKVNLAESSVTEGKLAAFLDPRCRRLGTGDVNLVLAAGSDDIGETTEDVLFSQHIDEARIVLFRHKVTAVLIDTFGKDVGDSTEVSTQGLEHASLIRIGSTASLSLTVAGILAAVHRLMSDRSVHRLIEFGLHSFHCLHTLDFRGVILHLLFHFGIGLSILVGEQTVLVTLGLHKGLCSLPCLVTLFSEFQNSHNKLPPIFDKIEPIHQGIGFDFGFCLCGFGSDFALGSDFIHEGIKHCCAGEHHADLRHRHFVGSGRALHQLIGEAKLDGFVGIHPSFRIHEMGELGTGEAGFDFVGIQNRILHAVQHVDSFLHFRRVTEGNGHGIMNHQHRNRRYQHLGTGHSDNGCRRRCNTVYLDGHIAFVIHQHVVNLRCCNAVAAGRVNPNGNVAGAGVQFVLKNLWSDIIVKPAFLGDCSVEEQRSLRHRLLSLLIGHRLGFPVPELLHSVFPPFLRKCPHP